jgi:DNA-binding transcriptional LysR family regulator
MIDRYLLRYFLAVIDCGSFSKAARQMNVAQPTLSVGIGKLERLLGATLFQRTARRVHLTEAGSRLAAHARRIENEFNLAEAAVLDLKPARELRLGVISTFPMAQIAESMRLTRRDREIERLQIITGNERELLQRLQRGQIDVALTIIREGSDRFASEVLFEEPYALAMHDGHRFANRAAITAEELADETMIVRRHCEVLAETSRHFTERGVRPFFSFRSTNDEQVLALVRAGLGITVMPVSYSSPGVVNPALSGFDLTREVGLLYGGHADHLQHERSPVLDAIRTRHAQRQNQASGTNPAL